MRFITQRTRYEYWSSSVLSLGIRKMFGLENPKFNTLDGWDSHEKECKEKAPFIHWLTSRGFNKLQNIWLFIPDLIWIIQTADIWTFLRNLWLFRKALWRFKAYDYTGLLLFMETATKDIHECHKNHGHLMRSEQTAKELLVVSKLCKRIREDKYTDEVKGYRPKEGSFFGGKFYQIPNTLPSIKSKHFYKMRENVRKNDLELLCKILNRKLLTFWD
jgi:hypothetical protein